MTQHAPVPLPAGSHEARGRVTQFRPASRTHVYGGANDFPVSSSTQFSYDIELDLISLQPPTAGVDHSLAVRVISTNQVFDLPIGNTVRIVGTLGGDHFLYAQSIFDENNNVIRFVAEKRNNWLMIVLIVLLVLFVVIPMVVFFLIFVLGVSLSL